jgi:hypothetical protein
MLSGLNNTWVSNTDFKYKKIQRKKNLFLCETAGENRLKERQT